jgi:hypothetical protein
MCFQVHAYFMRNLTLERTKLPTVHRPSSSTEEEGVGTHSTHPSGKWASLGNRTGQPGRASTNEFARPRSRQDSAVCDGKLGACGLSQLQCQQPHSLDDSDTVSTGGIFLWFETSSFKTLFSAARRPLHPQKDRCVCATLVLFVCCAWNRQSGVRSNLLDPEYSLREYGDCTTSMHLNLAADSKVIPTFQ